MAMGPLVRVLAQVVVVAGGAIGRAAMEAYREAAAGRGGAAAAASKVVRRQMSGDEARKVLGTEGPLNEALLKERFELLHKLNAQTEESSGSPYLQARITAAHKMLSKELGSSAKADEKTE
mmetsp:Transcript_73405/g.203834  ORF Transcript_73405/g.203834 Transcript_73405/m.203834 type:complete len:121 (-) Transcript_73405:131-493(-)|eukprot:CAMPEP_0117515390 /NCGR_PEP_ID=MMETSP0784-20121206/30555_1 /TAXON_ID=39447 /ORGANISM="" /LENGTH=120 /DNA_ID=CAMNT_0005311205 /DNA_START=151 /DNA_END=513 /DNA_ORIENTATION=-